MYVLIDGTVCTFDPDIHPGAVHRSRMNLLVNCFEHALGKGDEVGT
jgi:hypothetical protein